MSRIVRPFGFFCKQRTLPASLSRSLLSYDWTKTAIHVPLTTVRTFCDDKDMSKRLEEMRSKWATNEELEADGHTIESYIQESNREFQDITIETFNELIKNDEDKKMIEGILTDYDYLKYTSDRVPVTITVPQMKRAMEETSTFISRTRFFDYLFQVEFKKLANKRRKERIGALHRLKIEQEEDYPSGLLFNSENRPIYRKWHNSLFMRIKAADMKQSMDWAKCRAAMFNHKLCFDVGFEEHMTFKELTNLADQLTDLYGLNQTKKEPFDLTICNYPRERTRFVEQFEKRLPNLYFPNSLITVRHESYLDLYDRRKIIYLTPDCNNNLDDWDTDDVIVVGGIVDLGSMKPLTRTKAKKEGLRMARLPLDKHVVWGSHKKVLPLNHVLGILNDFQQTKDWRKAIIANVSSRKLKSREEIEEEENYRREKLRFRRKNFFSSDQQQSNYNQRDKYQSRGSEYKQQNRRSSDKYIMDNDGNLNVQSPDRGNDRSSRDRYDGRREGGDIEYHDSYDFKGKFGKNKKDDY